MCPQPLPSFFGIAVFTLAATVSASAQSFDASWTEPSADRWNYGFNTTSGTRSVGSVFGYTGDLFEFDERDGQVIVQFDTSDLITPGLGPDRYQIKSIELTVMLSDPLLSGYDPTRDEWNTHLAPDDPDFEPDVDPGRPIELFATGFRNGIEADTWTETTDFSLVGPFGKGVRSAYAAEIDRKGSLLDVSNSISDRRTPTSLAVGIVEGASAGAELPEGTVIRFTFDGSDPAAARWLAERLDAGRIHFSLSSLIEAQQQGGDFVNLYLRENPLVDAGVRSAATLAISGIVEEACNDPGDLDHDCLVGGGDIGIILSLWGTDDPDADLDGSGLVDGGDFGILLALFD
ncbi:MAG: hypothetical protein VX672_09495 [Planctomycetota bacterium]|nr:hypothetical protein [Planctomycetota bacterium]